MPKRRYEAELLRLRAELTTMTERIRETGARVVVFEGREAAGKGGVIKRISRCLSPRICRIVALPAPTAREPTAWYRRRGAAHLPSAGELVRFDRSWCNRAGVEHEARFQAGLPQLVGIFGGPDRDSPWSGWCEARSESKSVGTRLLD